jgi:V/A-type H+/Na+-transporting ATPase subunit E
MSEGAPSIIDSVVAKSEADAKRVVQIAERVAERDEAAGRKAAEEREAKAVKELDEQAAAQKALAAAQAQAEAERRRLAFRQDLVEKLLVESLSRLKTLPRDDSYLGIIEQLLGEAAAQMPVKEAVLLVSQQDRDFLSSGGRFDRVAGNVKSATGVALKLSSDTVNTAGGVVLSSADGKVSVYNTFDEIAYRRRSELKGLIAQELFG